MGENARFDILDNGGSHPVVDSGRFPLAEKAILLSPRDNVAVARGELGRGLELVGPAGVISLRDSISTVSYTHLTLPTNREV